MRENQPLPGDAHRDLLADYRLSAQPSPQSVRRGWERLAAHGERRQRGTKQRTWIAGGALLAAACMLAVLVFSQASFLGTGGEQAGVGAQYNIDPSPSDRADAKRKRASAKRRGGVAADARAPSSEAEEQGRVERSSGPLPAEGPSGGSSPRSPARSKKTSGRADSPSLVAPPKPASPNRSSLDAEREALQGANAALGRGDAPEALRRLNRYFVRFSPGVLQEEAKILRFRALCGAGRVEQARAEGRRFAADHPGSAHAAEGLHPCAP